MLCYLPLYLCLEGLFLLCMRYNLQNFIKDVFFNGYVLCSVFFLNKLFENMSVYLTSLFIFICVENVTGTEKALKKKGS